MTLNEYYNFPEDANVSLKYTSFFDEQPDDFPCPVNMAKAFYYQERKSMKNLNTENTLYMESMFSNCSNLLTIPLINTSNVVNFRYMFYYCSNLLTIPLIDTSNGVDFSNIFAECPNLLTIPQIDTSNVVSMSNMFYKFSANDCKLESIPPLDCSKVTNMGSYFGYQSYMRTVLTDVGGWINLKCNWNDGYGLNTCPNLTYESCINILNGLYDFTGNGETPNSSQGKLKVSQNFISTVGDEISIGLNKGWTITT